MKELNNEYDKNLIRSAIQHLDSMNALAFLQSLGVLKAIEECQSERYDNGCVSGYAITVSELKNFAERLMSEASQKGCALSFSEVKNIVEKS
ncbi:MAG: hypothetical protein IE909_16045 [Campylobacterales bacterium]|nr:hypothetical protein [Campylobacterales bacterium]